LEKENKKHQKNIEIGLNLFKQTKYSQALNQFKKISEIKSDDFIVYWYLGHTEYKLHYYSDAIKSIEKSINIKSKDALNQNFLATIYMTINQHEKAIKILEELLKINFNNKTALINLAKIYTEKGNFIKATKYYLLVLEFEPKNYGVYYELIKLNKNYLNKELINQINNDLISNEINDENKIFVNYILAKNEKQNKNYKLEIELLFNAHSDYIKKKKIAENQEWNYYSNLLPQFVSKSNNLELKLDCQIKPIFIMGLPRSGTTLVESIISSGLTRLPMGGEVESFSKVFFSKNIIKDYESKFLSTDFCFQRNDYELMKENIVYQYDQLKLIDKEKNYQFTDKSLENFLYINIIRKIFPNAKFIYCQRNPFANIIAIIKNFLPNIYWTHTIDKIFKYFEIYNKNLNDELAKRNSDFILLNIENLTNDPKKISKEIFNFLELEWSAGCINLKESNNIIKTASNVQLRRSIKKHNLEYLDKYIPFFEHQGKKYSWFKS
tara:strand:- start:119 stop:1603 length:1485 start_codon:yes stop_codon:yes gene_type:complete